MYVSLLINALMMRSLHFRKGLVLMTEMKERRKGEDKAFFFA